MWLYEACKKSLSFNHQRKKKKREKKKKKKKKKKNIEEGIMELLKSYLKEDILKEDCTSFCSTFLFVSFPVFFFVAF